MKLSDVKDVAILAAVAIGGWFAWKAATKVPEAYNAAVDATSDALWSLFGPKDVMGETLFYTVNFSNGRHAIPSKSVDSAGRFTYRGAKFIMRKRTLADGTQQWWAFAG